MNMRKYVVSGLIAMLLLATAVLFGCVRNNMNLKKTSFDLSSIIECENIDDISMIIYYKNPFILTRVPWTVDTLIDNYDHKIVVDGNELEKHFDLFNQINDDVFIRVENSSYMNVRVYYIVESKKNGKLFDVAMWGGKDDGDSIFVNGVEIEENDIFYDLIMPFLPEDAAKELYNKIQGQR